MREGDFQDGVESAQTEEVEQRSIRELEAPLKMILAELHEQINGGAYSVIIGDDVSGRVPTLVLAGVIRKIYERDNRLAPEVRFIAGSTWLSDEKKKSEKIDAIADVVERAMESAKSKDLVDGRVLFVTELIAQGRTVLAFAKACEKVGLRFDIATAAYRNKKYTDQALVEIEDPNMRIAYGNDREVPSIFYDRAVSGLEKNPEDLHAHRIPTDQFDKEVFMSARRDVSILTKHLLQYWDEYPSKRQQMDGVFAALAAMRDQIISDYKKAIEVVGSQYENFYEQIKKHGRGEMLQKFSSLYEEYKNDPVFRVVVREKSKEEQGILELLQKTAEAGRPMSEGMKAAFREFLGDNVE